MEVLEELIHLIFNNVFHGCFDFIPAPEYDGLGVLEGARKSIEILRRNYKASCNAGIVPSLDLPRNQLSMNYLFGTPTT